MNELEKLRADLAQANAATAQAIASRDALERSRQAEQAVAAGAMTSAAPVRMRVAPAQLTASYKEGQKFSADSDEGFQKVLGMPSRSPPRTPDKDRDLG